MYTYLTGCDSIYLFGSESSLIKSLDSMATKRLNSKEENAIANIAAYLNYYSSSPKSQSNIFLSFRIMSLIQISILYFHLIIYYTISPNPSILKDLNNVWIPAHIGIKYINITESLNTTSMWI